MEEIYGKMMYIETAVKNIALECIMKKANSESIQCMLDKTVSGYSNAPNGASVDKRKKLQSNKLQLKKTIQSNISYAYGKSNPKITHYYNSTTYTDVPIWALFETMTMGDFGYLLSCLTIDVREDVSRKVGLNLSSDTNRELIYKYLYALKDLRNAVAHNDAVFDTRFRKCGVSKPMKQCLITEIGVPYMNFETLGDYIILIAYFCKILKVPKNEINTFVREYEKITKAYEKSVNQSVVSMVIHKDLTSRMGILKKYI